MARATSLKATNAPTAHPAPNRRAVPVSGCALKSVGTPPVARPPAFTLNYRDQSHAELPHVVKFSGGRSSGTMLFSLLESGALSAARGDVVVFNNTSAEHPATYDFVRECKNACESEHGLPFFLVEYCTYEDAQQGVCIRIPTFRLANANPHSQDNPEGYRWRGEVFEELMSAEGGVPSIFSRNCTMGLKMEVTRSFLGDWLLPYPETMRRGHYGATSAVDPSAIHRRHIKHRGEVPRKVYLRKKEFVLSRPHFRESQRWSDFSKSYRPNTNAYLRENIHGDTFTLGTGAIQYVGIVGLRADEKHRVEKTLMRADPARTNNIYGGEHVYAPLFDNGCVEADVLEFWERKPWKLNLAPDAPLSNCTFCFMKGMNQLRQVGEHFRELNDPALVGTPCDLKWWAGVEGKYAKDYDDEGKTTRKIVADNVIGFFGARGGYLFKYLSSAETDEDFEDDYPEGFLPCDCTD